MTVAEYNSSINALFNDWIENQKDKGGTFIKDGVISPNDWFAQDIRPLFLLKEAYGEGNTWNLVDLINNTSKSAVGAFAAIPYWTEAIFNTTKDKIEPFKGNSKYRKLGNDMLKKIAVVNVKKYNGKSSSQYNDILKYAEEDSAFLKREIEIIDPTIIICGYTIRPLEKILDVNLKDGEKYNELLFYTANINGRETLVIDFWHPSLRTPKLMSYYGLANVYQIYLQKLATKGT